MDFISGGKFFMSCEKTNNELNFVFFILRVEAKSLSFLMVRKEKSLKLKLKSSNESNVKFPFRLLINAFEEFAINMLFLKFFIKLISYIKFFT